MELKSVVGKLEEFAPLSLAGSWDNVGLLIEPMDKKPISKILLTNDLTEPVMDEAIAKKSDMIISYHPPIFRPMKALTSRNWKERIAIRCIENRIALYSPHTSWDAIQGGINEWLLLPFGAGTSQPCEKLTDSQSVSYTIHSVQLPGVRGEKDIHCGEEDLEKKLLAISAESRNSRLSPRITKHEPHPLLGVGPGRVSSLNEPISLEDALKRIKGHLGLKHVRLAVANGHSLKSVIKRVGVCAGSGGSVLAGARADLVLTGEMSHHEVLDFVHKGISVILTDHSNTERGYHTYIREKLMTLLDNKVEITVSTEDRDPLEVV